MGFQFAAMGYILVPCCGSRAPLRRLLFKKIVFDGVTYTYDSTSHPYNDLDRDEDLLDDEYNTRVIYSSDRVIVKISDKTVIEYYPYDDIVVEELDPESDNIFAHYKKNETITICKTALCFEMICIGEAGDGCTTNIDDSVIADLLEWKTILIQQGRIEKNLKFSITTNCCS
jgi:hypothetical protein